MNGAAQGRVEQLACTWKMELLLLTLTVLASPVANLLFTAWLCKRSGWCTTEVFWTAAWVFPDVNNTHLQTSKQFASNVLAPSLGQFLFCFRCLRRLKTCLFKTVSVLYISCLHFFIIVFNPHHPCVPACVCVCVCTPSDLYMPTATCFIFACVCLCVCVSVCVHAHVACVCVCVFAYICVCVHACMSMCVCVWVHVCVSVCACMRACVRACVHVCCKALCDPTSHRDKIYEDYERVWITNWTSISSKPKMAKCMPLIVQISKAGVLSMLL